MFEQQRVIEEKRDLDEKREELSLFINRSPAFHNLTAQDKQYLWSQEEAMEVYSDVLGLRIETFAIPKAASHPDVPRPSNNALIEIALQVCHAIEQCGSSPELTHAVSLASDLHTYLRKPVQE